MAPNMNMTQKSISSLNRKDADSGGLQMPLQKIVIAHL